MSLLLYFLFFCLLVIGALSFGGAVVFGTGSNRESSSGDGKRRRSSDNSGANSSSGSCSLRKEEPYGILKRRVSRRDYEFEGETTSHSLSGGSSTNSTPRKSILKYDGDHVGIIGGGDASINPLNSNPSPSSQSEDKRLKGVLKKDSSYEETLRRPILKNTSTEENISFQEQQHQQSSLLLSSSCSSEDIARTFNDVIIDPIPNERRHEEEEDAEAALPREEDVEEAQPEEEEQQMRVSKLSEPPPSVVNISADGDLASKLQQLAVKAEAIKQQQQQQKETSRMPLTTPLNKCRVRHFHSKTEGTTLTNFPSGLPWARK